DNIETDIFEATSHLENQGYQVNHFRVSSHSTQGLVFVHSAQLTKLRNYGWLTLIDSTHKTNKYDWCLFTLYIHDGYGCWDVGAHFFISREDGDTVAEAIKIIRSNCQHWMPRYILMNQSNVEANAIKKAFLGLQAGEQECVEGVVIEYHLHKSYGQYPILI
ncbi:6271_t:CDS:1, partial [Paraglomus brasilianum]